jgi:hypothetical protein
MKNHTLVEFLTGKKTYWNCKRLSYPTMVFYIKNTRIKRWNLSNDNYEFVKNRFFIFIMEQHLLYKFINIWEKDNIYRECYQCIKQKLPYHLVLDITEYV